MRRPLTLLLGCLVAAVTAVAACSTTEKTEDHAAGVVPTGVTWASGVNANSTAEVARWTAFRKRTATVAVTFTDRSTWRTITQPDFPVDQFAGWPGTLSIAQPLFPQSGNLAACAAGQYDAQWRTFGTFLVARNRGNSYVRLGWEFNGDYFWWAASNAGQWKTCFQKTVTAIRSTDPAVRIDWTQNAHYAQLPPSHDAYDAYPGDAYVDVIGIDSYDHFPASRNEQQWARQCRGHSGLCGVIAFAAAHGKKFSVPEWGVVRSASGGKDNPFYVEKMYQTFEQNAGRLAYEAYFTTTEPDNVLSAFSLNPRSSAAYLRLFGPTPVRPTATTG